MMAKTHYKALLEKALWGFLAADLSLDNAILKEVNPCGGLAKGIQSLQAS